MRILFESHTDLATILTAWQSPKDWLRQVCSRTDAIEYRDFGEPGFAAGSSYHLETSATLRKGNEEHLSTSSNS